MMLSSILISSLLMPNIHSSTTLLIFLGSYKLSFKFDFFNKACFSALFIFPGSLP